jgi:hypothetical protein
VRRASGAIGRRGSGGPTGKDQGMDIDGERKLAHCVTGDIEKLVAHSRQSNHESLLIQVVDSRWSVWEARQ